MSNKHFRNFFASSLFMLFCLSAVTSCVSMQIKGRNPVQRAQSAAGLLVEGKITDAYIKQYNKEMTKALAEIEDKLIRLETNPEAYEAVADGIQDWIDLYDEIYILEKNYPDGLFGKKQSAFFEYIDYRPLKEKAAKLACESQFQKAQELLSRAVSFSDKTQVLDHLTKAKTYSSHLDDEINLMGAQINYEEAERLFTASHSSDLKKSWQLYTASSQWIADYKNSSSRALEAKNKAAGAMIREGNEELKKQHYTAFRKAYALFEESKSLGNSEAEEKLAQAAKLLTVRLGIVYSGRESYYPNEQAVKNALSHQVEQNSSGPMFVETDFIYMPSSASVFELFINTFSAVLNAITTGSSNLTLQNYDLIAYPGENFNKIMEDLAQPVRKVELIEKYYCETRIKEPGKQDVVSVKEVSVIEYNNPRSSEKDGTRDIILRYWAETGKVLKDVQIVEIWKDYSYDLYDVRKNRRSYLAKLSRTTEKTVFTFEQNAYSGSEALRPKVLKLDKFYVPGKYREFGLKINDVENPYEIVTASYNSVNDAGKTICSKIRELEFLP